MKTKYLSSWKRNVPIYGVLWGHLFNWKKIRCQVWKFRNFVQILNWYSAYFSSLKLFLRAAFSFRQALSRLALFTLLCCLAAALPRVQARCRFVFLRCNMYKGDCVILDLSNYEKFWLFFLQNKFFSSCFQKTFAFELKRCVFIFCT